MPGTHEPEVWLSHEEPIATFFLRLPETLAWPKGLPVRNLRKMDAQLHGVLVPPDETDVSERESPDRKFHNLIRAHVLESSILFHQVTIDLGQALGLDATLAAFAAGLPALAESDGDTKSELGDEEKLRGWATVAEVAIPLRVLAATSAVDGFDDRFELPDAETAKGLVEDALVAAISAVSDFQSAYHAVTRRPLTLLTRQLLPPHIPLAIRTLPEIAAKERGEVSLFPVNTNVRHVFEAQPLEPEQVHAVITAGSRDQTLLTYLNLHQQGSSALINRGNTREAVVMLAAAAEALLNIVLCHMRWEDCLTPELSTQSWPQGLATRVKSLFAPLLGGDWSLNGRGAVGTWAKDVAAVRHRVVHGGYLPTWDEAEQSLAAVEGLLGFIGDRLVYGANLRRYPRTASELLNENGLRRRNRYPRWLQDLQEDPGEPLWNESFGAWYATHLRLLADEDRPRVPDPSRSALLAVLTSSEDYYWVLRDPLTRQAAEVVLDVSSGFDPVAQFRRIQKLAEGGDDVNYPISIECVKSPEMSIERVGSWVEDYHLCPLAGVMRDGSDLVAPWPTALSPT